MENINSLDSKDQAPLFNSPLESGVRAAIILNAFYPKSLDLIHLVWFDHLVVHTADIDGPVSLHPDIPHRTGELIVRRQVIEEGLALMQRLHLVEMVYGTDGISYFSREESSAFSESLSSPYCKDLKECAMWLKNYVESRTDTDIRSIIANKVGKWAIEFHGQFDGSN